MGELGREVLERGDFGGSGMPSPAAASVRRNSTHSRENDCAYENAHKVHDAYQSLALETRR